MDENKAKRLESIGFKVGKLADFINLSPEEQSQIDNVIIKNGKPIGICHCLGKGKESCKGNGWVKVQNGYQRCPSLNFFKTI